MKLNATPRHYMPLPQNQSDDEESGPSKEEKVDDVIFKNSFNKTEALSNRIRGTISEDDLKKLPMSPMRIVLFILSLIMCVLFIVIFVFFIPCTVSDTTLESTCHLSTRWTQVFHNLTFSSLLTVVQNDLLKNNLVIVGFHNEESGLLAMKEKDGTQEWQLPLNSAPYASLCDVIDANGDGIMECLFIGYDGLFTAIDIQKGEALWYLHNHSKLEQPLSITARPIVFPDCDGDNIPDLLIAFDIVHNESEPSRLAVVSGGTGRIIGSFINLLECAGPVLYPLAWNWRNKTDIVFFCKGQKKGHLWMLPSQDVCRMVQNKYAPPVSFRKFFVVQHFRNDIHFYKTKSKENKLKYQLLVVLDGQEIHSLERSTQYNSKTLWKINLSNAFDARIIDEGVFVENSYQLLVKAENGSHSILIGLNVEDGSEVWSFTLENQTIASVTKLPKFFDGVDGLLLKSFYKIQNDGSHLVNSSEYDQETHKTSFKNGFGFLNDNILTEVDQNYILLKVGNPPLQKIIDKEQTWVACKGSLCKPNMFHKNTALASKSEGSTLDLVIVSDSIIYRDRFAGEDMTVKMFNLKREINVSSCSN